VPHLDSLGLSLRLGLYALEHAHSLVVDSHQTIESFGEALRSQQDRQPYNVNEIVAKHGQAEAVTAAMLPVPPIQLPASEPKAFHASAGSLSFTIRNAMGAPSTTPAVPKSMTKMPRPIILIVAATSTFRSIMIRNIGNIVELSQSYTGELLVSRPVFDIMAGRA